MYYECAVKRLESNEIAVAARPGEGSPKVQAGAVFLEVERSIVDARHLVDRALASGQLERNWTHLDWCSLVGRVIQVGGGVDEVRLGDRVSAIGPVASRVVLPAQECLVVPDELDTDQAAYWALLVALVRQARQIRIEIGESVLVLGGGLVGHLIAQLSVVAGATLVVGVDPGQRTDDRGAESRLWGPVPTWVTHQGTLERELPQGKGDILIDILGDFAQLASILPMLRTGGRALLLATDSVHTVDFDLYPGIHRRSLKLISGTLRAALRQSSQGAIRSTGEVAFIRHLLRDDRLGLTHRTAMRVHPVHSDERISPVDEVVSLIVQWEDRDETS
jgi:NADPH:quinone reductase-like Zn-dependent oxidoreductase